MSELPRGWAEANLDELVTSNGVVTDGDWVESKDQDPNGEVRLTQLADVGEGEFRNKSDRYLTLESAEELGCTFLEAGDVLIARMPDPLGRACIFPGLPQSAITVVDVLVFRSGTNLVSPHWIMSAINAPETRQKIIAQASGTTRQRISGGNLKRLPLPLPPLAEQKRIVAKLDALNAKSARARTELARIETLVSRYKQAVLSKAFSGELTREWRRQNRLCTLNQDDVLHTRREWLRSQGLKTTEVSVRNVSEDKAPFALPPNWSWITAEGLTAPITKGTTPAKEKMTSGTGVIPFIKVYNLTFDGTLDFSRDPTFVNQDTHCKELKRSIVKPGDVLMNIVGPPLGKVSVVPDDWPEWNVNQAIAIFRPLAFLNNRYLALWLLSDSMLSWAKRDSKATAGQSNLTLELCRGIPVPACHIKEQREIVRRIESAFAKIDRLEKEAKRAMELVGRLEEAILAKAFRGELVPRDENDEPAELLLARIRAERDKAPKARRGRKVAGQ